MFQGGLSSFSTFNLIILPNRCPDLTQDYATSYSFFAHHTWTRTYIQDNTIVDLDTPYFSAEILTSGGVLLSPIWLSVDVSIYDRIKVILTAPTNSEIGTY